MSIINVIVAVATKSLMKVTSKDDNPASVRLRLQIAMQPNSAMLTSNRIRAGLFMSIQLVTLTALIMDMGGCNNTILIG